MGTIKQINRKKKKWTRKFVADLGKFGGSYPSLLTAEDIQSLKPEVKNALLMIDQLYGYYAPTLVGFVESKMKKSRCSLLLLISEENESVKIASLRNWRTTDKVCRCKWTKWTRNRILSAHGLSTSWSFRIWRARERFSHPAFKNKKH